MATKKKLLQAAAGTAAASGGAGGAIYVDDVFATKLYDGANADILIENGISLGTDNNGSSIYFDGDDDFVISKDASESLTNASDNYTLEFWIYMIGSQGGGSVIPVAFNRKTDGDNILLYRLDSMWFDQHGTSSFSTGASSNAWTHVAITYDNSTLKVYHDGTNVYSFTGTHTYDLGQCNLILGGELDANFDSVNKGNFGNSFNGYISNVMLSDTVRYTSNFTPPTAPYEADANTLFLTAQGDDPFLDNSGNNHGLNGYGQVDITKFGPFSGGTAKGGMVLTMTRSQGSLSGYYWNTVIDTERGGTLEIATNASDVQYNIGSGRGLTFFDGGYLLANDPYHKNINGQQFVSYTFAKQEGFMDIVTYTGTGSNQTISHSLNAEVGMIWVKRLSSADSWHCYHRSMGANHHMRLNTDANENTNANIFISTPTSSSFEVGSDGGVNGLNSTYVAYIFAHHDANGTFGENSDEDIISCGSYIENGNEVVLGWEPQFVLMKAASGSGDWAVLDTARGYTVMSSGSGTKSLALNTTSAELSNSVQFLTHTGFVNTNTIGREFVYMAIRRPLEAPTSATQVYTTDYQAHNAPSYRSGFRPDVALTHYTAGYDDGSNAYPEIFARVTGAHGLQTGNARDKNNRGVYGDWGYDNGFYAMNLGTSYGADMFKRAKGFLDVVHYKGTGTARQVAHQLGTTPKMLWIKDMDTSGRDWNVYHAHSNATNPSLHDPEDRFLVLNANSAPSTNTNKFNNTAPTDTHFTVGTANSTNASTANMLAYVFGETAGISKFGSYVGNGSSLDIDCGFENGARLVMIKRIDQTGSWGWCTSERGLITGNDKFVYLNSNGIEETAYDVLDPLASGFTVTSSYSNWNASGGTYIFYAIA